MKTPDEIKKGLECCGVAACGFCPYEYYCNLENGFVEISNDALAYIQQLEAAQPKWISVEERLPKYFVSVLGFMTDAGQFPPVRECYAICDGKAWIFPALTEHHPVSHWMPLPESPKEDA